MVIPTFLTTAMVNKNDELVKKLQKEARMLFYDRMMYDINDSLTSILAVCDDEGGRVAVPKIKDCINRINLSLNNTKKYQSDFGSDTKFDIHLVIKNLIRLIKGVNREVKVTYSLADIKAPTAGNRDKFEELLLNIFVDILEKNSSNPEITIELKQKNQDAMVTILSDSHVFSKEAIKEIVRIKEDRDFKGIIQTKPQGNGVEVIIKIPLQFNVVKIEKVEKKVEQIV